MRKAENLVLKGAVDCLQILEDAANYYEFSCSQLKEYELHWKNLAVIVASFARAIEWHVISTSWSKKRRMVGLSNANGGRREVLQQTLSEYT